MRIHHTKAKGDLGVILAEADLVRRGFIVLNPRTEHAPFDLVAYDLSTAKFHRIQVKYRSAVGGKLEVKFTSTWVDGNGVHRVPMNKDDVDVICVYCPETDLCYYVDPKRFGRSLQMRIAPARNNQSQGISYAENFLQFPPVEGHAA